MSSSTYGDSGVNSPTTGRSNTSGRDLARLFATIVGATFLLVGILGFIPGITQNFDEMQFAGHESEAELLGLFQVSVLHNIVHLLFGIVGLAAARRADTAISFLLAGGVVYLLLAVYGFIVGQEDDANFIPVNVADDWLHVGLGVGMLALGAAAKAARDKVDRNRV